MMPTNQSLSKFCYVAALVVFTGAVFFAYLEISNSRRHARRYWPVPKTYQYKVAVDEDLVDPIKALNVPVVLRVDNVQGGFGDKYHWWNARILGVYKNESKYEFKGYVRIAGMGVGAGMPDGESTVYLSPYNNMMDPPPGWVLDEDVHAGDLGYSHVHQ